MENLKMESLLERTRILLGWPTNRKILQIAQRFPEEECWRYAVAMLEGATRPNETYLVSCLETARARLRPVGKVYDFGDRECPWYRGLYCSWAPSCKGWEQCARPPEYIHRALEEVNAKGRGGREGGKHG